MLTLGLSPAAALHRGARLPVARHGATRAYRPSQAAPRRGLRVVACASGGAFGAETPKQGRIAPLRAAGAGESAPADKEAPKAATPAVGGGSGSGSNGAGGSGGGGGGGSSGGESSELKAALAAAGRKLDSFPADFARALSSGVAPASAIATWMALERNALKALLLRVGGQGFRERLLGDPLFLNKLAIELGIGVCTKISAEYAKRAKTFWKETDFVVANVIMAIIADFMLTWLPAPTLPLSPKLAVGSSSALARFLAGCPDNAFQIATAARSFSLAQRGAAVLRNGAKLFVVGTGASFIGTGITNGIIAARKALDPNYSQKGEDMDIVRQSAAYGLYMSVSSNLRYQLLAGVIEQRMIEPLLHGNPLASTAASFVVRTGNTFLGSLLWVDFLRLLGLQKVKGDAAPAKGGKAQPRVAKPQPAKPSAAKPKPIDAKKAAAAKKAAEDKKKKAFAGKK